MQLDETDSGRVWQHTRLKKKYGARTEASCKWSRGRETPLKCLLCQLNWSCINNFSFCLRIHNCAKDNKKHNKSGLAWKPARRKSWAVISLFLCWKPGFSQLLAQLLLMSQKNPIYHLKAAALITILPCGGCYWHYKQRVVAPATLASVFQSIVQLRRSSWKPLSFNPQPTCSHTVAHLLLLFVFLRKYAQLPNPGMQIRDKLLSKGVLLISYLTFTDLTFLLSDCKPGGQRSRRLRRWQDI